MDSSSKIHKNASSDDVMLSFDNLSLNEVLTNDDLCLQKCIATEAFHQNLQPDIISNKISKTKPSVSMLNEITSQTQDCSLTILDDSCCPDTNSNLFLNSTYVVPDDTASSARHSINAKIDFLLKRNGHSNSHQQPNSSDCVITLYESSESDTSIDDSESSLLLHSESADCSNTNELSYTIKRTSSASEGETTEEYSNDSEDSSDFQQDSDDISNESEDSSDSDSDSSDSDSVSINDDSDEEPNPSNDEESEDSDDDSSTTSEDKPDTDDESERDSDESSDESDDSSDDDKSVDLDEASESSSESSEESD